MLTQRYHIDVYQIDFNSLKSEVQLTISDKTQNTPHNLLWITSEDVCNIKQTHLFMWGAAVFKPSPTFPVCLNAVSNTKKLKNRE